MLSTFGVSIHQRVFPTAPANNLPEPLCHQHQVQSLPPSFFFLITQSRAVTSSTLIQIQKSFSYSFNFNPDGIFSPIFPNCLIERRSGAVWIWEWSRALLIAFDIPLLGSKFSTHAHVICLIFFILRLFTALKKSQILFFGSGMATALLFFGFCARHFRFLPVPQFFQLWEKMNKCTQRKSKKSVQQQIQPFP